MNKMNFHRLLRGLCFALAFLMFGCNSTSNIDGSYTSSSDEVYMGNYYELDDFKDIVIGESTFDDVYVVAPTESMQATSYGGVCQYPLENGGFLRIKFFGKDLVVGDIEEIFLP